MDISSSFQGAGLTPPQTPKPRSTLGSLAIAMVAGALIAITALYFWGAQVAKEEGLAGMAAEEAH